MYSSVPQHKSAVGVTLIGRAIAAGYIEAPGIEIDLEKCMGLLTGGIRTDCNTAVESAISLMTTGRFYVDPEDIEVFKDVLADQYDELAEEIGHPE